MKDVNYIASITDFFKSPNWMMNLLLGGVCVLIPLIGPIVVLGWLITGFWARQDERCETFPDFDFSNFGKYLERGLWPFLVSFAVSMAGTLVMIPIVWILMIPMMLIGATGDADAGACIGLVFTALIVIVCLVLAVALLMVLVPLKIRATITQDFVKSFDLGFVKRFLALTWKEIILSSLFICVSSVVLTFVGMLVFCVGVYFASVLVYFAWTHLSKQLYQLYLSRGGAVIPLSPKLTDLPPGVPGV